MIAAIKQAGSNTRGLLAYLYGPGRHDEHLDPHIVAGFAMLGMPDPGRDENATLTELARYLDEPVRLRNGEFGKPVTEHVWHCPVRTAPEDRYLSDAEWAEIAQRIVQAAGIAPAGDDLGCRWIAVRLADDHIHILATTVREDGRRPKLHGSGVRVGDECRAIEKDYGLRQLKKGDGTGNRRPTQAEMHKAERLGWDQPSAEWLQDRIRAAIPHVTGAEEFVAYLEASGVEVQIRRGPSGDLLGYAAGRPGDVNEASEQIYHPGSKISPTSPCPKSRPASNPASPKNTPPPAATTPAPRGTTPPTHSTPSTPTSPTTPTPKPTSPPSANSSKPPPRRHPPIYATNSTPPQRRSPEPSAPRSGPKTAPPTPYAARHATSSTPPPAPTAAPWPPWSQPSSGPPSSPGAGTKRRTTPTKPTQPARPSSTSRRPPTWPSPQRSPNSQPDRPGIKHAAFWPATYGQPSPTTPSASSPIRPGPRSPPSPPTPKPAATNPTNSSRKPPPNAN